jgi:MSHA biogenesis protein MshJ
MKEHLQQLAERIDAMELRQRVLLLVASLALLFFMADSFAIQPTLRQQQADKQAITDWELKLDVLRQRSSLLSGHGPDSQRDEMHAQLAQLDARLHERLGGLLAPDQATRVLEQVLAQEQGLVLREMSAGSMPLTGMEILGEETLPGAGIGRYQLQLQFEGSYLATLRYLRALEALPWKFFWEGVDYEVTAYPTARITLDIYTLGLVRGPDR